MEKCGIYCIENLINHKKYVGLSKNILRRWADHRNKSINSVREDDLNKPLYMAIKKYGLENFSFYILEECEENFLKKREIYWIEKLNSYYEGYNATLGGDLPEGHALQGEKHPLAKLTENDVLFCRDAYAKGARCQEIYDQFFIHKIGISGFKNMWFGRTWKNIKPEVFKNNPHARRKITNEDILDIRTKYRQGFLVSEIDKLYQDKYSHSTINDIINNKRFSEIQPDIKDNHRKANQKLTEEDIRLIKQLKAQGYLHKNIRAALNNKVSMTTISDIVNGKRYSEIE